MVSRCKNTKNFKNYKNFAKKNDVCTVKKKAVPLHRQSKLVMFMSDKAKLIIKVIIGVLIAALTALGSALGLTSCNVTRTVTTQSEYFQRGDTAVMIHTRTTETYDASKKL